MPNPCLEDIFAVYYPKPREVHLQVWSEEEAEPTTLVVARIRESDHDGKWFWYISSTSVDPSISDNRYDELWNRLGKLTVKGRRFEKFVDCRNSCSFSLMRVTDEVFKEENK